MDETSGKDKRGQGGGARQELVAHTQVGKKNRPKTTWRRRTDNKERFEEHHNRTRTWKGRSEKMCEKPKGEGHRSKAKEQLRRTVPKNSTTVQDAGAVERSSPEEPLSRTAQGSSAEPQSRSTAQQDDEKERREEDEEQHETVVPEGATETKALQAEHQRHLDGLRTLFVRETEARESETQDVVAKSLMDW